MENRKSIFKFFWKITYSHVIAYFIAGIFALVFIGYKELFATETMSLFMKPVNDPIVMLGPTLQIIRGILIAIAIYPLKDAFLKKKRGYIYLGIIILVFSLFSTIGPTSGSLDGFIYTIIPIKYQLLGYPESFLYILLFLGILKLSDKFDGKKIIFILPIIIMSIIVFVGIAGYISLTL